jgi:moderate conductance mechanosensitive channel
VTELLNRLGNAAPWTGTWAEPLLGVPLRVLVVVLAGLLVRHLLHRVIDRVCAGIATGTAGLARLDPGRTTTQTSLRREQRARTISSVLDSLTTAVVVSIVVIIVLEMMSVPVAPLLASAGIVGVALGFGAQSLVKDVISGVFMLAEDQYGVGDVVDLGDASGTVEAVGLRVTQLRDVHGTAWYVRNGEVLRVGNQSQGWARAVLDIPVGYGEDLTRVQDLLMDVASSLRADPAFRDMVIDQPEVWGVENFSADSVVIRLAVTTQPLKQWDVARELRRRIKDRFDVEGIEMAHAEGTIRIADPIKDDRDGPDDDPDRKGPTRTRQEPAE